MLARSLARSATKISRLAEMSTSCISFALLTKPTHHIHHHQPDPSRLEIARINSLLFSLDRYVTTLKQPGPDAAIANYVRQKLSQPEFRNLSRPFAFDKIIILLLQHRRFEAACKIYDAMCEEGILPSSKVRTKMLGISIVCSADGDEDLLRSLRPLFSQEAYDEYSLRELLDLLAMHHPPDLIDRVFKLYITSHGEGYIPSSKLTNDMIDIQIRGGLIASARELFNLRGENIKNDQDAQDSEAPYPYVAMLKALRLSRNPDAAAIDAVLQRMKQDAVVPDIAFFNALIGTEVWRQAYHQAFTLYRVIKTAPEDMNLRPDAFTFASLFKAMEAVKHNSRKWRSLATAVSPRELYREMLAHHLIETRGKPGLRSSIITPSVLLVALRTFMVARDYPAAFVVLRSFTMFRLKVTLRTYLVVIKSLAIEMRRQLKTSVGTAAKPGSLASVIADVDFNRERDTKLDVCERILALSTGRSTAQNCDPEGSKSISDEECQPHPHYNKPYRMPTVAMLTGAEQVSPDTTFHVVPLQRILRRAILLDIGRFADPASISSYSTQVDDGSGNSRSERISRRSPSQIFSEVLAETKRIMIPEVTPELDTKMRRLGDRNPIDRRSVWAKSKKFLPYGKMRSLPDSPHIRVWE